MSAAGKVAIAVVVGALLAPAGAQAGEYTVNVCRHADGTPAPTDGWQHSVVDDGTGNVTTNSCAQGGHVDAALGAGAHGKAGGPASVTFGATLPSEWARLTAWWAYRATPSAAADDPTHRISSLAAGTAPCTWGKGGGCTQFGSLNAAPLADVNRMTIVRTQPGQSVAFGVMCDSSPGQCPATSGDPTATLRLWRLALTMNDSVAPVLAAQPDLPARAAGPVDVPFAASDVGSGVHSVRLMVDGKPAGEPLILDVTGSRCVPYSDGTFDALVPCPTTIARTVALDTSSTRVGRHEVVVRVADAAGNATDSAPMALTIAEPAAPPQSRVTIRVRVRSPRTVRVSGRLTGVQGRPIGRARLTLRRQVPGRKATFARVVTRANGTYARTLTRGRRTARVSVRWRDVRSRTVRIVRRASR